jgi:hypothetical protein
VSDTITLSAHCRPGRPAVLVAVGPADVLRAAAAQGRPVTTTPGILPTHDVHLADVQTDAWEYRGRTLIAHHVDHTRHAPGSPLADAHLRIDTRHRERDRLAALAQEFRAAPMPTAAASRADDDARRAAADAVRAADLAEHETRRAWIDAALAVLPPDLADAWEIEDIHTAEWSSPTVGELAAAHDRAECRQAVAREHARRVESTPSQDAGPTLTAALRAAHDAIECTLV